MSAASGGTDPEASESHERRDSALRRIVANTGWLLGARGLLLPLALLESALVARLLGAEGYGMLGVVMSFVAVVHQLTSFRMHELVVGYMSKHIERGEPRAAAATLKASMLCEGVTALVAFSVIVIAAPWAARVFVKSPDSTALIWGYGLIILSEPLAGSTRGALQVLDKFATEAAIRVGRKVLLLALVGVAFLLETPLEGTIAAYVAAALVAGTYQIARTNRELRPVLGGDWLRTPLTAIRGRFREMARFALFTNIGATLSLVIREADVLWISYFRPPVEAGYYKLATSLLKAPFAAASPMTAATYPELARVLARGAVAHARHLLRRTTALAALWVVPVSIALAILAPWVVRLIYGAEFEPVAAAIRLLLIGATVANLLFWTRSALLALGRPEATLKIATVNAVLKVTLALAFIPAFGYLAAAAILSGLQWVGVILALFIVRSEFERRQTAVAAGAAS